MLVGSSFIEIFVCFLCVFDMYVLLEKYYLVQSIKWIFVIFLLGNQKVFGIRVQGSFALHLEDFLTILYEFSGKQLRCACQSA